MACSLISVGIFVTFMLNVMVGDILKDNAHIDTSTAVRLFTKSQEVSLLKQHKLVTVHRNGWVNIGFDYLIEAHDTILLDMLAKTPRNTNNELHFCVGFASKDVIHAIRNQLGSYIDGWCFRNNGHIYKDTKQEKWIGDFWTNQKVRLKFSNYKITVSIKGHELETFDVKHMFERNRGMDLFPAFSLHGPEATVEIVDFKVYKHTSKNEL
eukprot:368801_1